MAKRKVLVFVEEFNENGEELQKLMKKLLFIKLGCNKKSVSIAGKSEK